MSAEAHTEPVTARQPQAHVFLPQGRGEQLAGAAWYVVRALLFRWSPPPLAWWRRSLLRLFGARVHPTAYVAPSARVDFPWNLRLGSKVRIQHGVILNCMGAIEIGEGTLVSQYAHLCAGTHEYQDSSMRILRRPITIGRDVWIAADAFVGPGVTLGDRCLLAARSSAFEDLPADQVCIGEPARPRHVRFGERG